MKRALCLLLATSLVPIVAGGKTKAGGELSDPVEILKKADAACKAVKAVKYDVTIERQTGDAPPLNLAGSITLAGDGGSKSFKSLLEVKSTAPDSKKSFHMTGGSDGEEHFLIDHQAKEVYADPKAIKSQWHMLSLGMMIEFVVGEPFGDEIKGKKQELRGSKVINGEDCYEVYVVYATELPQAATWYFSKHDFLPRGRCDELAEEKGKVRQTKLILNLVVDPQLGADAFCLKVPEGYTKSANTVP